MSTYHTAATSMKKNTDVMDVASRWHLVNFDHGDFSMTDSHRCLLLKCFPSNCFRGGLHSVSDDVTLASL